VGSNPAGDAIFRQEAALESTPATWRSHDGAHLFMFAMILLIGIYARVWEFDSLPPGLNQDEASSGVDAYSLYRYGVDRNDISFPVHFVAWGSGQNALYAYALIPGIAVGGLTTFTVRLPMLLAGILSLPLAYFIGLRMLGRTPALLGMFLLAICPWHILLSRWGLESNFLPFVFLAGFACLLNAYKTNHWYVLACAVMALCLYAYGPAYVEVPVFLACASLLMVRFGRIGLRNVVQGGLVFALLAAPMVAFVLVNSLGLETLHVGPVTIPRLPAEARFQTLSPLFHEHLLGALYHNFRATLHVLSAQTDGLAWNSFEPFGYFYKITFPIALLGLVWAVWKPAPGRRLENWLLVPWIGAAVLAGMLQPVNINRINLIFIPLVLCTMVALTVLVRRWAVARPVVAAFFAFGFASFVATYHGQGYRQVINQDFNAGLLPAIDYARHVNSAAICVTGTINMPYVFVMFLEKQDPRVYENEIDFVDSHASFRQVRRLGRYTFGEENCAQDVPMIHVLRRDETLAPSAVAYRSTPFGNFQVLVPIDPRAHG
jgi:hypothetical protein